jgi:hypothetical protein
MSRLERIEELAAQNLLCAKIVLADKIRYGGDGALLVIWAQAVFKKAQRQDEWELTA